MSRMRNLTLASAKHLLSQGHITPAHHQKIVGAAMSAGPTSGALAPAPTMPKMPTMPKGPVSGAFGSLGRKKKVAAPMFPQQAQAPIPGVGGPPMTPPGMSPGFDEQ